MADDAFSLPRDGEVDADRAVPGRMAQAAAWKEENADALDAWDEWGRKNRPLLEAYRPF